MGMERVDVEYEHGASSVEYGLLISFIAAVLVIAVLGLGGITGELFGDTCTAVKDGVTSAGRATTVTC